MQTHIFHVQGMHCPSCPLLIESELQDLPNVRKVQTSLAEETVSVTGDFDSAQEEEIVAQLNKVVSPFGYTILSAPVTSSSKTDEVPSSRFDDFKIALPLGLFFILLFIVLQKLGIVNLVQADEMSYGTALVIGLVASVSSCMAVVGGLILSISAEFAKTDRSVRPQLFFHVGRLVSFFVLGGTIGAIGSAFALGATSTFILGMVIGIVMLILGINLLGIAPWLTKLQPAMPRFIASRALSVQKLNHALTPLLVGVATFFLPCGFTQSMQLYTLGTGSFMAGGLTMLAFALGTLPVLALVSFGAVGMRNSMKSGVFFKTAGIIVVFFALLNIITSLTAAGIIPPLFTL